MNLARPDSPWLWRLAPRELPVAHVVAIHHAGGAAAAFREWSPLLGDDVELWVAELPGRGRRFSEPLVHDLHAVADALADAVQTMVPAPYVIWGHSMGALIAYEVAQRLRAVHPPRHLVVAGSPAPHLSQNLHTAADTDEEFVERLRSFNGTPREVLEDAELLEILLPPMRADFDLVDRYTYSESRALDVPITALAGADDLGLSAQDLAGWSVHTEAGLVTEVLVGDHFFVHSSLGRVVDVVTAALLAEDGAAEPAAPGPYVALASRWVEEPRIFEPVLDVDERAFRDRVEEVLDLPEVRARLAAEGSGAFDPRNLHRLLGRHGLLAPHWPTRFGGAGRSVVETSLVHEALVRRGLPDLAFVVTVSYVGTLLQMAGSEQLLASYLPGLASGELLACTLYSEPGVGSDLASLTTTAVAVEGGLRVSGCKVYSQVTDVADYAVVAARTSPRGQNHYQGICVLWIPLDQPGVRRRVVNQLGADPFSDVVLDDVFVPASHVLADGSSGWALLIEALSVERTGFEAHLRASHALEVLGRTPVDRTEFARLTALVRAGAAIAWRQVRAQSAGELDPAHAAASKWFNTELAAPLARSAWAASDGPTRADAVRVLLEAPGMTLSAGTSEMMLATVAAVPGGLLGTLRHGDVEIQVAAVLDAVAPRAEVPDDGSACPAAPVDQHRLREAVATAGLLGLALPVDSGGLGLDSSVGCRVAEELGSRCTGLDLVRTAVVAEWLASQPQPTPLLRRLVVDGDTVTRWRATTTGVSITLSGSGEHSELVRPACRDELERLDRLRRAAYLIGCGAEAVRLAQEYARRREQFGRPLHTNQAVSFPLAGLSAKLAAVAELVRHDADLHPRDASTAAKDLCRLAGELALDAAEAGLHVHGAGGLLRGTAVAELYRQLVTM